MLCLINQGHGWSILRPATLLHYPELSKNLDVHPVPNQSVERKFVFIYREGVDESRAEDIYNKSLLIFEKVYKP